MNETETFWNQLFQDKPIAEDRLQSIKLNVIRYIQEHPPDFQEQLLLAARKRWGMILLSLVTICCLVSVLLIYFEGFILVELLENYLRLISGFSPGLWLGYLWASVGSKVILLKYLKPVIELLWDNYSSYFMSILVLLVVMYRSESITLRCHKKLPIKE